MDEEIDVLLIGGGATALWLLARLRERGYAAVLCTEGAPGGAQSLAAQGIIHGGLKYALGATRRTAAPLQAMPRRWLECLAGHAAPDLRSARVHARSVLLWTGGGISARAGATLAARLLAARVRALPAADRPALLADAARVWRVEEPVVDVPSVIEALLRAHAGAIIAIDWRQSRFLRGDGGRVVGLDSGSTRLRARRTVLCAGEGNERLLGLLGARAGAMQRRPLQQVLVKHPALPAFYAHCVGARARIRLTVTSHPHADGSRVWYLGGDLAERGAAMGSAQLIAAAQAELKTLLPALSLPGAIWHTHRAVRAEPAMRGRRPEDAWLAALRGAPGAWVAWPTKLALLPRLADRLEALLGDPGAHVSLPALPPVAARAHTPWEECFP